MSDDYRIVTIRQLVALGMNSAASAVRNRGRDRRRLAEPPEPPDRPALRSAERLVGGQAPAPGEAVDELIAGPILVPDDLFSQVYDREDAKHILGAALRAKEPVHVLLEGPRATGKSQLLECVARMPHARWAVGGATSSSGVIDYLLEKPGTQILVIDELDKADPADLWALYSLMQTGRVARLQHGRTEQFRRRVRVFAACNSSDRLPEALLSRFVVVPCGLYSIAQRRELNRQIAEGEGMTAARAKHIAERVAARSDDPRDARDVARLAGQDGELDELIEQVTVSKRRDSE